MVIRNSKIVIRKSSLVKEKVMVLRFLDKYRDIGLLFLRIGIGVMFIMHGLPKLIGGPEKWEDA